MSDIQTTAFHYDEGTDTLIEQRTQDCSAIVESNKIAFNQANRSWKGDMHHVGRIPKILIEMYCNEKGITFREFLNNPVHVPAFLNNPDNAFCRTKAGRI